MSKRTARTTVAGGRWSVAGSPWSVVRSPSLFAGLLPSRESTFAEERFPSPDNGPRTTDNGLLLDIKPEMNHVAVLHEVVFTFQLEFALLAATSFAAELDQVIESSHLSSNKAALDV